MKNTTTKTNARATPTLTSREMYAARFFAAATENTRAIADCLAVNAGTAQNAWGFADKIGRVNELLAEARRLLGAV